MMRSFNFQQYNLNVPAGMRGRWYYLPVMVLILMVMAVFILVAMVIGVIIIGVRALLSLPFLLLAWVKGLGASGSIQTEQEQSARSGTETIRPEPETYSRPKRDNQPPKSARKHVVTLEQNDEGRWE